MNTEGQTIPTKEQRKEAEKLAKLQQEQERQKELARRKAQRAVDDNDDYCESCVL